MSDERRIGNDIIAVILLTFIVFLVASLATYDPADPVINSSRLLNSIYEPDVLVYPQNDSIQNVCGTIGAWMSDMLIHVLGIGSYYLILGMVALEILLFRRRGVRAPWFKTIGWMVSLIGLTAIGYLLLPNWIAGPVIGSGGYLGALAGGLLKLNVGMGGSVLVAISLTLIGFMMWTEYLVFRAGRVIFPPGAIAAASLLPFGILHGLMRRFNGLSDGEVEEDDEYEYEDEEEEDEPQSNLIRIRAGAGEVAEEELLDEADDEYEEEEDEYEYEEEEDEEEEAPVIKKVAEPEDVPAIATTSLQAANKPHFKVKAAPKPAPKSAREEVMDQLDQADLVDSMDDYELPSLDLLKQGKKIPFEQQKQDALKKARILENTCQEFGYKVKVVEVETGPVISQYEIQLEAGLRLNKITALADDLAIALRVPSVRIVAPIPGKNTVGVEVPNETRQVVCLKDVMEQCQTKAERMNIPLFLGNDAVGAPMLVDLAKMPHLLIAGRTGTGKSVCLNAIISSILMTRRPDEVRMLMIDPKMVELSGYGRLPHLMHPVVTDMKKAEAILAWAVEKMEDRYRLLAKAGVRHINSYNDLGQEELIDRLKPETEEERSEIPSNLPFIVIVADEMADLMMTCGKEVESHIIRLAQKSRAVGIHLILATQKPTVDVITGLIKSNLPARLAFQVASKVDSRVVLDSMGAEKLLGMGDMLFLWPGTSTLLRGQGTFLSDDEIDLITDTVSTGEQNFVHELVNMKVDKEGDSPGSIEAMKQRDELYAKAVEVVVTEQRGSVSLLQRSLGIGYGRAARLVDYMEEDGYVGPYNGSKSREVILTPEAWSVMQNGGGEEVEEIEMDEEPARITKISSHRKSIVSASTAVEVEEIEEVEDEVEEDEEGWEQDTSDELEYEDAEEDDEEEYEVEAEGGDELEDDEEYEEEEEEYEDEDDGYEYEEEEEYEDEEYEDDEEE